MNHQPEERLDAYLWDPAAPAADAVVDIERRLISARFDPAAHPLPQRHGSIDRSFAVRHGRRSRLRSLAWAATVLIVAGAGFTAWRWTWPEGRAWHVTTAAGSSERLRVGGTLQTDTTGGARVQIARIGTMEIARGTTVTLRSTTRNRHRLTLQQGSVRVRVWAPPFSVAFRTPAGEVSDLGCEFQLTVDDTTSAVRVTSGWVQLENLLGETLVPAGANSEMRTGTRPAIPVFEDAQPGFLDAVRAHERNSADPEPVDRIIDLARRRDVYTLLQLVQRRSPAAARLADRAAALFPPPDGVDPARVAAGDVRGLDRWITELPLPSPKGTWLWNWRDALPWFSRELR